MKGASEMNLISIVSLSITTVLFIASALLFVNGCSRQRRDTGSLAISEVFGKHFWTMATVSMLLGSIPVSVLQFFLVPFDLILVLVFSAAVLKILLMQIQRSVFLISKLGPDTVLRLDNMTTASLSSMCFLSIFNFLLTMQFGNPVL
jgi:hypothetical protein